MNSYRALTIALSPLFGLWLFARRLRGKEPISRKRERFGYPSRQRPKGSVLWLHAASVGEANSVLLLIEKIRAQYPHWNILLTTGTVTSAELMGKRLPAGVIHQFIPIDTPDATKRFMAHWRPDIGLWVESELWPNLIREARAWSCFMVVINGRMSERSYKGWQRFPSVVGPMLAAFDLVFAQSEEDAQRYRSLGAKDVQFVGNLKYDAALLPCNEAELAALEASLEGRMHWLAASTHPGEEIMAAKAHQLISRTRPNVLTIIVPRHANRGAEVASALQSYGQVALRSRGDKLTNATQFYVADTMGELGLFYRVSEMVFMGGSLVPHGGQNPLEPARLACAILTGPHTQNFAAMYAEMERLSLCMVAGNEMQLASQLDRLFNNPATLQDMQRRIKPWVEQKSGAADKLLWTLSPVLLMGAA